MVVRRAVVRSDVIPVGYLLELIDKLLLLKSLALKYDPGFQETAIRSHGFDETLMVYLQAGDQFNSINFVLAWRCVDSLLSIWSVELNHCISRLN
ncbi:hypothetical protein HZ326_30361 [Fusarium oxysporum f. sp. albedinis]|nr:hypothetical protein HZ326_30361 [Fusarium oxysporum f. sp. albedinis]